MPLERLEYLRGLTAEQMQEALATEKAGLERDGISLEDCRVGPRAFWLVKDEEPNAHNEVWQLEVLVRSMY